MYKNISATILNINLTFKIKILIYMQHIKATLSILLLITKMQNNQFHNNYYNDYCIHKHKLDVTNHKIWQNIAHLWLHYGLPNPKHWV